MKTRDRIEQRTETNALRKRKRGKVFTAADSTPIQARIPNAMFLEIERAARRELISIADFVRAALMENSNESETKMKPNDIEPDAARWGGGAAGSVVPCPTQKRAGQRSLASTL